MSELAPPQAAIPDGLLRTKLAPPRLHTAYVSRADLLARIDAGLTRKLTLISTPAGFGKTTLLAEWIADWTKGQGSRTETIAPSLNPQPSVLRAPVAWVTLDPGDNDPIRFWSYVISACRAWDPALG